jgi:hypothetical protein
MNNSLINLVGSLRTEVFGSVFSKKDTEAMIKKAIDGINIQIAEMPPQPLN